MCSELADYMYIPINEVLLFLCIFVLKTQFSQTLSLSFSVRVTGALVDQRVLADLITKHLPDLAKDVDVTLLVNLCAMSWFMAIFLTVLPFHMAVRIVDWFLLDGARSLFQIR